MQYEAALLIDGMKSLVRALRLLNEDAYTGRSRLSEPQGSSGTQVAGNLPCQPLSPPPFLASHILAKLHQVSNFYLFSHSSRGSMHFGE